jgi:ribosomal protein RSM22 (predicted rRNA methylase)
MRVPVALSEAFGKDFEAQIASFAQQEGWLEKTEDLNSPRFLARSVLPHISKLSDLFNRKTDAEFKHYFKESSNPRNLRMAYFLYFMPCTLFRIASVWAELGRLGYRWPENTPVRGLELGAGPGPAAYALGAAEKILPTGLSASGSWALVEQDLQMLRVAEKWATEGLNSHGLEWAVQGYHRKIALEDGLLPRRAPSFNLIVASFFLNEFANDPATVARTLEDLVKKHLDEDGLLILIEPALREQSRKLLSIRAELLKKESVQVLLPCLGHQACGALADPTDWCHEEVSWWRPPYLRKLDDLAELDHKSLAFSYLVLTKSQKPREFFLPTIAGSADESRYRLVSPARREGPDQEFFTCGQDGKRRARLSTHLCEQELERGDILFGAEMKGAPQASRVQTVKKIG